MPNQFQVVSGSIVGRDHIHDGRNNQDAFYVLEDSDMLIAVVCDGCGESSRSEVGAVIGSRLIAHSIAQNARSISDFQDYLARDIFWERVRSDALADIRLLAKQMGTSLSEVVSTHFLFTIVGVLITPQVSVFFNVGDGTLFVNGDRFPLGPFEGNAPPYLGYGLVATTQSFPEEQLHFQVAAALMTEYLESFLIGTDGVDDILASEEKTLPGKEELVGPIDQFWTQDRFLRNPSLLQRRLNLLSTDARRPDWEERAINLQPGLLHDDTTLVVGRRLKVEE